MMGIARKQLNSITAVLVSTMLALPLPVWAQNPPRPEPALLQPLMATPQQPDVDEATAGVVVQKHKVNGKDVTVTMVQVPEGGEAKALDDLARASGEQGAVIIANGPQDPALKAAKKSGFFSRFKTLFASKPEAAPVLNDEEVPLSLRQKVLAKLKGAGQTIKSNKGGVIFTVIYAGGMASFNYYLSGTLDTAMLQFAFSSIWAGLLTVFTHGWFAYLRDSGKLAVKVASLVGSAPKNGDEMETYSNFGKASASFAANVLAALFTLWNAGSLDMSVLSAATVLFYGAINNGNVWDPVVSRWVSHGKVGERFLKLYMPLSQVAGAALEVAAYFKVPHTEMVLGVVAASGLFYLFTGKSLEEKAGRWQNSVSSYFKSKTADFRASRLRKQCEGLLKSFVAPKPPPEPFISWASINHSW